MNKTRTLCIIFLFLIAACSDSESRDTVKIELVSESSESTFLAIPEEYIGPENLSLAQKAKNGGAFKRVPLAVTYPGLKPWPEKWREIERSGLGDSLVFMHISSGTATGVRPYAEHITQPDIKTSDYRVFKGERFGLKEYFSEWGLDWGYYYKAEGDGASDVFIACPRKKENGLWYSGKCRYRTQVGEAVSIEFRLPPSTLSNWKVMVLTFRGFISNFLIGEQHINRKGA